MCVFATTTTTTTILITNASASDNASAACASASASASASSAGADPCEGPRQSRRENRPTSKRSAGGGPPGPKTLKT